MLGDIRRASYQSCVADLADFNHIIGYQTVSALNELQCRLALADAALTHDQDTLAEYINQNAVNADARRQLYLQPADNLCHQIRSALVGYH